MLGDIVIITYCEPFFTTLHSKVNILLASHTQNLPWWVSWPSVTSTFCIANIIIIIIIIMVMVMIDSHRSSPPRRTCDRWRRGRSRFRARGPRQSKHEWRSYLQYLGAAEMTRVSITHQQVSAHVLVVEALAGLQVVALPHPAQDAATVCHRHRRAHVTLVWKLFVSANFCKFCKFCKLC